MRMTDHIQSYRHPFVVFAIVFFSVDGTGQTVFGCPKCVRKRLRENMLVSLLIANVLCWIPIPVIVLQLQASHLDTHPSIPPEYWYLARLPLPNRAARVQEERARRKRLWVILFILAIVIAALVFVMPVLADRR